MLPRGSLLPFSRPDIGEEEIAEVVKCLRSGWITTGPLTQQLERDFAAGVGAKHAVALSSCTAALHVTLLALGVGRGDEVIVPPLTWPATANMVVACGAIPVFADIDPSTLNIDPGSIARAITARTKAVIPVHFAGLPADLDAIRNVLRGIGREDIAIIEDAAHAAGATYKGRPIGATAASGTVAACFSFHPIKNMTTAEGGMVTTDDHKLAEQIKLWKFHGVERDAWKAYSGRTGSNSEYDVVLPGFKYNLTDLQSALGVHQLRKLSRFNQRRREIAGAYRQAFAGLEGVGIQHDPPYQHGHAWHLFTIRPPQRRPFVEELKRLGIGTGLHFEAVHLHSWYQRNLGCREGQFPVAEEACSRIVSLPLFPAMSDDEVEDVIMAVHQVLSPDSDRSLHKISTETKIRH